MNFESLRRGLAWGVVATLLLPVVLAVVVGLGAVLAAVGDAAGAAVCGRLAIACGVLWLTAIVATVAVTAVAVLADAPRRPQGGPPPRRRRRRLERLDRDRLAAERESRERAP